MLLIELAKDHVKLAQAEVLALSKSQGLKYKNYILIKDCQYKRLTLANAVYTLQFSFPQNMVFKLERHGISKDSIIFQKTITRLKEKHNVLNLSSPEKIFGLLKFKDNILFAEKLWSNPKTFLKRHPKSRPGFHPGACVPKFARVLINLSGITKGKVLDPFCGTGGFLIEGFDCGLDMYGSDINQDMLDKAKKNVSFYSMPSQVSFCDALQISGKYAAIVTEIPFGKTTILDRSVSKLVYDFLFHAKQITSTIVISVPTGHRYKLAGWRKVLDEKWYIHKSLSKRILVLEQ